MICLGCSCLCDDIECETEGKEIKVRNACSRGFRRIDSINENRLAPRVEGKEENIDNTIKSASKLLEEAKNPIIFGPESSTLETEKEVIELAKKAGAIIDNISSFGYSGYLVEKIFRREVDTCTLDETRDDCDVSIYWGCDPMSSHPRMMSRYSYYPRGKNRQRGWEQDRGAICIDVRRSLTAEICDKFIKVPPGRDFELMKAFKDVLSGKLPKFGDKKSIMKIGNIIKKAEFGVLFTGLGLNYSIDHIDNFIDLIKDTGFKLQPIIEGIGLNKLLFEETGHVNKINYKDKSYGVENSFVEALKGDIDTALIIGSDVASNIPLKLAKRLREINCIYVGPHGNLTSYLSKVNIPTAICGVESAEKAYRMDLKEEELEKIVDSNFLPDQEVLKRIGEAL